MQFLDKLKENSLDHFKPFIFRESEKICLNDIIKQNTDHLAQIQQGDVVVIIGDFDPISISNLIKLIDIGAIIVPLTNDTKPLHDYFFKNSFADYVLEGNSLIEINNGHTKNKFIEDLKEKGHPGLILFSTGTTGRPKAILHDFSNFIERYQTNRPSLKTLNFLLFDHIGGINTLFHTIMNNGEVFVPKERTPRGIANEIFENKIELLPTSPSFLRMMLIEEVFDTKLLSSLKLITYGTEKMDENTLKLISTKVDSDIRQTYGMSELGIFKVITKSRDDLWIKIVGKGIETKIDEGVLKIKSQIRMLGYLNADSPFDENGWYDTGDVVEEDGEWIKIVGRKKQLISTGGLKILPSEVEYAIMKIDTIKDCKVFGRDNPILGQHIEAIIELHESSNLTKKDIKDKLKDLLPSYALPHRIKFENIQYNHRYKKS
jgi:long-chain acyl-CoA synthetase